MLLPFKVLNPTTVAEASSELGRLGERAEIYAGGAELILLLRHRLVEADTLVNIKPIAPLNEISWNGGSVDIGATVTHYRLERDPQVRERLPMFAYAESQIGNIRVRSQGTLGGNLCFADPYADPGTALLVHETTVSVSGKSGQRKLPLEDFVKGAYETALEPDELLTSVQVPPLAPGWGHAYLRIERYHRPTLNVAAAVKWQDEQVDQARLAVGCVGPKAIRLRELESRVQGLTLKDVEHVVAEAKPYLGEALRPVDDLLGSADYKIHITSVLLGRALKQSAQNKGNKQNG
ncbi:MAG: FAD binding domain-containing protein [Candidatus Binatia bacterium]